MKQPKKIIRKSSQTTRKPASKKPTVRSRVVKKPAKQKAKIIKPTVSKTKQASKNLKKPVKTTRKPAKKLAKAVKKPVKRSAKLSKTTVGKTKQVRKNLKKPSKTNSKVVRKPVRRAKNPQGLLTTFIKKYPTPTRVHSFRTILLTAVFAGGIGIFCGHQAWASGSINIFGSKQVTDSPSRISSVGPRQNNKLFSTYPTWSQDFSTDNSGNLNVKYWNIYKGKAQNANHEAQYYTDNPANIRIKNGALSLIATHQPEPEGYQYASARIDTQNKLSFLYGRIDVTAKVPNGVGTWPAAWFLPANTKYEDLDSSDERSRHLISGGEMDLIEEVGFNPNINYGVVHTKSDQKNPNGVGSYNQIEIPNNNIKYNLYSVLWTPTSITYEVNNTPFFTYKKPTGSDYTTWPFDQPFYLILNLAVGGSWGGADTAHFPGDGIDKSALPASFDIKSIYYYPYTGIL